MGRETLRSVHLSKPTTTLDPVTFEVIRHRLWAINDDQARMAARLSGSPIVFEGYDFNAALTTGDGRGLFCGLYIMHHGATIDHFVRRLLREWNPAEIREGDMFFSNDPWWGALHASDGILVMPIFADGKLVTWSGIVMHDADVGGPVPGSMVIHAHDRFGEAPLFPAVKMVENFVPRHDIEQLYLRNTRSPALNALNMHARVGALTTSHRRVQEIADRYGVDALVETQEQILRHVEEVVASRLREIPDGTWHAQGYLDHDGNTDAVYTIRCAVTNGDGRLRVDFTGTSRQAPGPINCTLPATAGSVFGVILTFLCFDLPWAIGGLRGLVDILAQEATLNNAADPAPVSTASISAALTTQDVVANALAKMLLTSTRYRDEAQATWMPGWSGGFFSSVDRHGGHTLIAVSDMFGGGGGARTFTDGVDSGGIMHSMASRMCNVETIESRAPVLQVFRRELRDGGGPGRYRGGTGVEAAAIKHKAPAPALYLTFASGVAMPGGRGLSGGLPGAAVWSVVLRGSNVSDVFGDGRVPLGADDLDAATTEVLEAKAITPLEDGDFVISVSASGAGYGDPLARDAAAVLADVADGLVSPELARTMYGVVITAGAVDAAATRKTRDELRDARIRAARDTHGEHRKIGDHTVLFPICDSVDLVEEAGARAFRCTVCDEYLGSGAGDYKAHAVVHELRCADVSPANADCSEAYVIRQFSCPGCGTALATDVQERGEGTLPEIGLPA
jgi:N-methylhydantoinase B